MKSAVETVIRRVWWKRYKHGRGREFGQFHDAVVWIPMPELAVDAELKPEAR